MESDLERWVRTGAQIKPRWVGAFGQAYMTGLARARRAALFPEHPLGPLVSAGQTI